MKQPRVWALIIAGIVVLALLAPVLAEIGLTALLRRLGLAALRQLIRIGGRALRQQLREKTVEEIEELESSSQINWDKQGKHSPGHKNYNPSRGRGEITHPDPQKLIDDYAGTGQPTGSINKGQPGYKERIDFGEEIGIYKDEKGNSESTSIGIIHYDKQGGVHITPARPKIYWR